MQPTYKIGQIADEEIDRAYLLVGLVAPRLALEEWRALCFDALTRKRLAIAQDDIVVAVNPVGYVQGVCVYAVRKHPSHDRILDVSIFVVTSAADEAGVASELLDHLRVLARREACQAIRIWTLGQDNWNRHLREGEINRSDHGVLVLLDAPRAVQA
ncbi:hypothetical protein [Bosea psychrotolerans]|uniref:Acetyltransferase (GNAT) family protein n=1 Tax=Bosea psychrotolerans TaxID=1871628 RepID=A0A2S4LXL9_9HYPH|nr:hypothetical protein [Bosea psychrotolerans]POR47128.1 hypothetical protein CYD53_12018 [Bosea psychrotolerans]